MLIVFVMLIMCVTQSYAQQVSIVKVQWDDTVNTEHEGYVVSRKSRVGGGVYSAYAVVNTVGKDSREYNDNSVEIGKQYCYTVAAYVLNVRSSESNEACTVGVIPGTPQAPTNVRITVTITVTTE